MKVALGRHVSCRGYATAACYQWRLEAALSTNCHALIIDMAIVINDFDLSTFSWQIEKTSSNGFKPVWEDVFLVCLINDDLSTIVNMLVNPFGISHT